MGFGPLHPQGQGKGRRETLRRRCERDGDEALEGRGRGLRCCTQRRQHHGAQRLGRAPKVPWRRQGRRRAATGGASMRGGRRSPTAAAVASWAGRLTRSEPAKTWHYSASGSVVSSGVKGRGLARTRAGAAVVQRRCAHARRKAWPGRMSSVCGTRATQRDYGVGRRAGRKALRQRGTTAARDRGATTGNSGQVQRQRRWSSRRMRGTAPRSRKPSVDLRNVGALTRG